MKGKELLRMLTLAGMSRRALGRELGIADSTVGRWIKNEIPIGSVEGMGLVWYFGNRHGIRSTWKPLAAK